MLDIAEHDTGEFLALKDIAQRQNLSKKYMEQILPELSKANLLVTKAGHYGGYRLARLPSEYSLGEILRLTEGTLAPVSCLETDHNPCQRQAECATLPIWAELDRMINNYLDGITLQDVLDQQRARLNRPDGDLHSPQPE